MDFDSPENSKPDLDIGMRLVAGLSDKEFGKGVAAAVSHRLCCSSVDYLREPRAHCSKSGLFDC